MNRNDKYRELFLEETRENIEQIYRLLEDLKSNDDIELILKELFRMFHSIKGSSAAMGVQAIAELSHKVENSLQKFREAGKKPDEQEIAYIEKNTGLLEEMLNKYEKEGKVEVDSPDEEIKEDVEETKDMLSSEKDYSNFLALRIYISEREDLPAARIYMVLKKLNSMKEFSHSKPPAQEIKNGKWQKNYAELFFDKKSDKEKILKNLKEFDFISKVEEIEKIKKQESRESYVEWVKISPEVIDKLIQLVGEIMIEEIKIDSILKVRENENPELLRNYDNLRGLLKELRDEVIEMNQIPFQTISTSFPRTVRDISKKLSKKVNLKIEGENIRFERNILTELYDPIIHIIRNAIDHGLETKEERIKSNKNETGKITVSAYKTSGWDIIEISDDGKGMNKEGIVKKAIEKGLITEDQARNLSESEIYLLTCESGFSIKDDVSEISGRGVGMDVVYNTVKKLRGAMEIKSKEGEGTTITLKLPSGSSIIQAVLFRVGEYTCGINSDRLIKVVEKEDKSSILDIDSKYVYFKDGEKAKIFNLNEIFGYNPGIGKNKFLMLLDTGIHKTVIPVRKIKGVMDIYVKPLRGILSTFKPFFAYTISSEGEVAFLIDHTLLN